MKEDQRQRSSYHHKPTLFSYPAAFIVLILLSYALGYLSASYCLYPRSIESSPPPITVTKTIREEAEARAKTPSLGPTKSRSTDLRSQLDNFQITTRCANPLPPELIRQTILDRIFNGTSPYVDFPPPHVSTLLRSKRIKGWGSYNAVFKDLIQRVKPRTIIEVGTFLGASALHMAELTRELGLQTQILCVDDFRGWPSFRDKVKDIRMVNGDVLLLYQFMQNVIHLNSTGYVLPVPFSSGSALEALCEWGVLGDLIEIDAGHDFQSAWADINRAYRMLRPGGVIFGDDYFTSVDNRGVRRAVNLFAQINGLKVRAHGRHWVIDSAKLS
ncbi:uncharacterized protein LOC110808470 [Carica papaya]|uniref:uncharacterized protein LOC110808470 n=1 Tax=Carica papaya TaxID=3649 RepID=UPI000B8CDBEB|nr:uncharacterized protein LOC110808470 [Carica papaya]